MVEYHLANLLSPGGSYKGIRFWDLVALALPTKLIGLYKRESSSGRGGSSLFRRLNSGTVIAESMILKDIRYSVLIALLAVIFIANRFNAESMEREITVLEQEVMDLRAESLSVSARLGTVSRQSEIIDLVRERGLGLEELREPPYRIVVNEKTETTVKSR